MTEHTERLTSAGPHQVTVTDGTVGAIGDHNTVMMPRREIVWPVVVGAAPPLASAFQNRAGVLEEMAGHHGVVLRQVMAGDGGVGKSQIAAGLLQVSDADLRVWVHGESRAAILTGYADAAVRLDLADRDLDPATLAACFLGFLAGTDKTWLVVVDDLADPADMQRLWPAGGGRLVVTTRRRDAALSGGGRTVIDVGVYTPAEAEAYLAERLTPFTDQLPAEVFDQGPDLADDLGFLPLGLAHAAAVIIDQGISCAEYRSWFADRARSLEELFPDDADTDGYARTVAATWALAIDAANQLDPVGLAPPLAYLVAVCDPVGAPETLFTSNTSCRFLAGMLDLEKAVPADQCRRGLRALHRLSLITHTTLNSRPRAVRMHNLTARAILHTLNQEDQAVLVRTAADALVEIWPEIERETTFAEALRANTETLTRVAPDALWNDDETGGHPVLFYAGRSLRDAGLVALAVAYYNDLTETALGRLGADHPDTLTARSELAGAYESAGELGRAIPLFEQTLADCVRVLGPDHPSTLTSRNNLAGAYESAGDLGRAIPLYEQTRTDRVRVDGPDHPDTLTSRNNLAGAYQSAGDLGRAIPLYEQTLTDLVRVLGPDHPDTLTSRNNLAYTYESAGDLGRAIPLYEQNLTDRLRVLGPDHPDTLTSRNNLAYTYESAGDLGRAIPLYEQTLTDRLRVLGPNHPDTLTSRNNLAYTYESAGDLGRAIPLYEQTLTDRLRVLGPDHPNTLTSRNNLAYTYESAGDLDRAIPLYEQTLADRLRVLGPDHPDTLTSRNNLAAAYQSVGDLDRTIPLYEQTLTDRLRVLGPDHPNTLTSRNNLAAAYQSAGDLDRAIPLYKQTLTDFVRVLGPDHPDTLTSRNNLANAYQSAGDLGRAIPLHEQTLADRVRVLGPDHPNTLTSRNNLAYAYQAAGASP